VKESLQYARKLEARAWPIYACRREKSLLKLSLEHPQSEVRAWKFALAVRHPQRKTQRKRKIYFQIRIVPADGSSATSR